MTRLCAISVDLDEIPNYYGIHGLDEPTGSEATLVYDRALARLCEWADAASIPLTLFAIGSDLQRSESAGKLEAAAKAGHEMGNHTLDHRYDLTRLGRAEIRRQIVAGADAIERATGERPVGFRAPGYTVSDTVYDVLEEQQIEYGSSVFPCPPYYLAKVAVITGLSLLGRPSRSVRDTPRVLGAPTSPYRVGRPYHRRGHGMLELPIQVTRGPRLPYIGTYLALAGTSGTRWLTRMLGTPPLVNLELHGIDVLDESDGLEGLAGVQREVRIPWREKLQAFDAAIETLRDRGYSFVTLREAARAFA